MTDPWSRDTPPSPKPLRLASLRLLFPASLQVLLLLAALSPTLADAEWVTGPGFRTLALSPATNRPPGFTVLAPSATGLAFTNRLAEARYLTNQIHLNGSGVALGDVDGDGRCDVFLAGLDGANALYRNLGNWRFAEITEEARVSMEGFDSTGAVLADLDGDGDLDLVVNTIGRGTHLLLNDGRGRFGPAPGSPFNLGRGGMSLAVADTDGDGDLDLFLANYRTDTFRDQPGTRFRGKNVGGRMVLQSVNGRPVTEPDLVGRYTIHPSGVIEEHGEANAWLRNLGGGRFEERSLVDGTFLDEEGQPLSTPPYDWTLSVLFRDWNGDRAPDLYVCNDFSAPDALWFNDGQGRFRRAPAVALRHTSMFSMGVDSADLDHDGRDDLVVADMLGPTHTKRHTQLGDTRPQFSPPGEIGNRPQYAFNQLFLSRGDGTFAETGWYAGMTGTDWTWNLSFLDVDLDGEEDLLAATGHELEMMDADIGAKTEQLRRAGGLPAAEVRRLKLLFRRHHLPNAALRNQGDLTFSDSTAAWRFGVDAVSTGMAMADLDGDGDLDVVLNNLNSPAVLLRNDAPAPRLAVRLRGRPPNSEGIGAKVRVTGGPAPQQQEIVAGGRYLSSDEAARTFATGEASTLTVEVTWRNGGLSTIRGVRPNHRIEIEEAEAGPPPSSAPPSPATPLFRDASATLDHLHVDELFDDFSVQPLLPFRLSQMGPGVACADLDGDGRDDLIIGTGRGGRPAAFRNTPQGLVRWPGFEPPAADRDWLSVVTLPSGKPHPAFLATLANWEDGSTNGAALVELRLDGSPAIPLAAASTTSPGPLAVADFDGDGDLDAFVGGGARPGRYPVPTSSLLLVSMDGRFEPAALPSDPFAELGLVNGAIWTDLGNDGFADLVVACDWGPLRVFRNQRGRLTAWDPPIRLDHGAATLVRGSPPATLSGLTGDWRGLASADLDGDGRLDLVAGNWGLNSRWQLAGDHRLRLYYGDYDRSGTTEILEAAWVPELRDYAPLRTLRPVADAMPFVRAIAPDHAAYGQLTIPALLGPRLSETRFVEAATFASLLLLNRGDHFEVRALPREAQWSPVFAVVPADFDGDGHEDVFVSQNFFAVNGDSPRLDAGRGLLLLGDGKGGLRPVAGQESGLLVYGEQRGAATADFDADGRPDLVVAQNAAATRLFHNVGGRPGLRVRLVGGPANPAGIGSQVRLRYGDRLGPARELQAGSGWLSQNSPTTVLALPAVPVALEVRWPGGFVQSVTVPDGAAEIVVRR